MGEQFDFLERLPPYLFSLIGCLKEKVRVLDRPKAAIFVWVPIIEFYNGLRSLGRKKTFERCASFGFSGDKFWGIW